MPVAHVRVLVSEDCVQYGRLRQSHREVAPWSDPLLAQLLVARGFRLPLADMLARYEAPAEDDEPLECYFGESRMTEDHEEEI